MSASRKRRPSARRYGDGKTVYPDLQGEAEQRRAFIWEQLGSGAAEIDGTILVQNLAKVEAWLATGAVPVTVDKRHVKAVK